MNQLREDTKDIISKVKEQVPDKSTLIRVFRISEEEESNRFASKIVADLKKEGYTGACVDEAVGGDLSLAKVIYLMTAGEFHITIPKN